MLYGVDVPNFGPFANAHFLADLAAEAEAAGWDGFFVWDHIWHGPIPTIDPWVALTLIAVQTHRVRIGPMVTPLPRRRPVVVARQSVALDHISLGRLTLGVGIGSGKWEWNYLGEQEDLKTRGDMLDEGLSILTGAWNGQPFQFRGVHYRVGCDTDEAPDHAIAFLPQPIQSPRIPIWVAGYWPNLRPFRRAVNWDGVFPIGRDAPLSSMMSVQQVRQVVNFLNQIGHTGRHFDIVQWGITDGKSIRDDAAVVATYEEVGATWWLENFNPVRFGVTWTDTWPIAEMQMRIRQGPPKV